MWEIMQTVEFINARGLDVALCTVFLIIQLWITRQIWVLSKRLQDTFPSYTVGYSDHTLPKEMKTMKLRIYLALRF